MQKGNLPDLFLSLHLQNEMWEHELGVYSIVFENEFGTMQE